MNLTFSAFFLRLLLPLLSLVSVARGYDIIRYTDGQPVTWNAGPITMTVQLGSSPTLSDGSTYNSSVQTAMQVWNAQLGTVQFTSQEATAAAPIDNNHINEIGFDSTVYGTAFDANVLAVTLSYLSGTPRPDGTHRHTQSDIIFNSAYTWDSYPGPLRAPEDIRRVALHELGHVLGLDHPDEATPPQYVTAMMNSHVSNLDTLASDDIAGAQFLYGNDVAPTIAVQPSSITVSAGSTAQFIVGATGRPAPTYRWQRLPVNGGGWSDIFDGGNYLGTGTVMLAVSGTSAAMGGDKFRCVIANAIGTVTSNAATLTVNIPPVFNSHPANKTVDAGQSATFSVTVSGAGSPTFQWQWKAPESGIWDDLYSSSIYPASTSGTTTTTLSVFNITQGISGYQFRCVATNGGGSATSNPATLTVNAVPPVITYQPTDQAAYAGIPVEFGIAASGDPSPAYQWQRLPAGSSTWTDVTDNSTYSGATTNSMTIINTSLGMSGDRFRCKASNSGGTAISNPALLTIFPISPVITSQPADQTVYGMQRAMFEVVAMGYPSPTYQWQRSPAGSSTWTNLVDGGNYWGSGSSTLFVEGTIFAMSGDRFRSVATNVSGNTISVAVTLTVNATISSVSFVAAGDTHSVFIKTDGTLWSVGDNQYGQLGTTGPNPYSPSLVATGVASATAGYGHTLFVKTDGTLWAMGRNGDGQLGDGTTTNRTLPVQVATGVAMASAGLVHSAFVKTDGTLWVMGDNISGKLGDGTFIDRPSPIQIASGVTSVSAGLLHTVFVKTNGTLWAMGENSGGQLGDGTHVSRSVPVQVTTGVASVSAGDFYTMFVKTNGTLWAVGANGYGNLGDGTTTDRSTPLQVATGVSSVSAGSYHTLFIKTDGTLWAMGNNNSGELGIGFTPEISTPVQVATGVSSAAAGLFYSLFVKTNQTIWGMGQNNYRQLGDGHNTSQYIPEQISASITIQPLSHAVIAGSSVTFTTASNGAPAPTYQWRKNGVNISGATNNSYTIANVIANDAAAYSVLATNATGTATSGVATLMLQFAPIINTQPQTHYVTVGAQVTLSVGTSGYPAPTYQWKKNGANIGGATSAAYVIASAQLADSASYTVTATNLVAATTSNPAVLTVASASLTPELADFNHDGHPDFLWRNTVTGTIAFWFMNGTTVQSTLAIGSATLDWEIAGTGDFNNDGETDLLWRRTSDGSVAVWLMNGTALQSVVSFANIPSDWIIGGTGDFNGDGKVDILWRQPSSGKAALWLMNGPVVQSTPILGTITSDWIIGGTGDFNNDGKVDILWRQPSSGKAALWLMNGTAIQSTPILGTITSDWIIAGTGDFNNDGHIDIIWRQPSSGKAALWLMNGTAIQSTPVIGTISSDWVICN